MTIAFRSGLAACDHYIEALYDSVRGMSSRFAATITCHLMRRQSDMGINGLIAEIGTFEGRFFIALAHALQAGEKALAIDLFNWPNDGLLDLFRQHLARCGIDEAGIVIHKGASDELSPADIRAKLGSEAGLRLFHIDGEHSREAITRDLDLAHAVMHAQGLIILDDMLHPGYPLLVIAVHDWLQRHPDMKVPAIIDREDIVAAAKFVLCRADAVSLYEDDLMASFPAQHFVLGAEFESYFCVVLTPKPRLAEVD